ncbi:hypothetical protein [Jeotgalibaca porci]|uniref:hypothetical protein n=1 Tax=Jeotgalibaca porci TaxID=1868793 RepID=UPI0035A10A23
MKKTAWFGSGPQKLEEHLNFCDFFYGIVPIPNRISAKTPLDLFALLYSYRLLIKEAYSTQNKNNMTLTFISDTIGQSHYCLEKLYNFFDQTDFGKRMRFSYAKSV